MASNSLPAPVRPANPEERDFAATATRRTILGAALIAPAMIAPAAKALGAPSPVDVSKWTAAVAAFKRADEKMKAIGAEHTAAYDRYSVEREALGERPIKPAHNLKYPKPIRQMTIAEIIDMPKLPSAECEAYEADLAAWKAKAAELETAITGDVDDRWEAAVSVQDRAAKVVFAEPAPDHVALSFKMELAEE